MDVDAVAEKTTLELEYGKCEFDFALARETHAQRSWRLSQLQLRLL